MPSQYATIVLRGGLGNQLFQIFTLLALSYYYNFKPVFPEKKEVTESPPRKMYWDGLLSELQKCVGVITDSNVLEYREPSVNYTPFPLKLCGNNVKLIGQYMTPLYFEYYKERILLETGIAQKRNDLKNKYSYIFTEPNVRRVSVHFRLGDYLEKQCYHPVMPTSYYVDAITQLMTSPDCQRGQSLTKTVFYVFYEPDFDAEINQRIAQLYSALSPELGIFEFRKVPNMADEDQLLFMSLCDDHVLANSTFSWWGAYLNDALDKRVLYPSLWYGHQLYYLESPDMFPATWTKIDVEQPTCNCI